MKKIIMMVAAMMLLIPAETNAQGFLKNLKPKAQQVAVGNSEKTGRDCSC